MNFDLLNEKIHPRKRLKGRRGCKGGPKGSQRKVSRRDLHNKYPENVQKFRNKYFKDNIRDKEIVVPNTIDDGDLEYQKGYGVEYSLNKKKRWELRDKVEKKGGLHYETDDFKDFRVMERKIDQEKERKKEDMRRERMGNEFTSLEAYHNHKKPRGNSGRKKKKKIMEMRGRDRHYKEQLYKRWYNRKWKTLYDRRKGNDKRIKKKKNEIRNDDFLTLHKRVQEGEKEFQKETKRKRNQKKKKFIKCDEDRKRIELEKEEKEKEEELINKLRSNPDRYLFEVRESDKIAYRRNDSRFLEEHYSKKKFRKRQKKKKRSAVVNNIRSSLTNKNTVMKTLK